MSLKYRDETYSAILSCYQAKIYTPEIHNEMVKLLKDNGVTGDLDEKVQAFANVQPAVAAFILQKAKRLRTLSSL